MKRLFLAVAVLGLMACAKKEAAPPAETQTPAAAPAPAMTDTMKPAATADTSKMAAPAAGAREEGGDPDEEEGHVRVTALRRMKARSALRAFVFSGG